MINGRFYGGKAAGLKWTGGDDQRERSDDCGR